MYKFKILSLPVFLFLLLSFKSDKLPETFQNLLDRSQLVFEKPEGLIFVKPIENRQMNYEYAVKYPDKNFEVRYAIRPLDELIKAHNEKEAKKKPGDINIHPNKLYKSLLQVNTLNISGGEMPEVTNFGKEAVIKEFNADWGAASFVEVGKEFGQEYKYCMLVALHKDNVADAYIFYLSDTEENFDELIFPAYHSLRFK